MYCRFIIVLVVLLFFLNLGSSENPQKRKKTKNISTKSSRLDLEEKDAEENMQESVTEINFQETKHHNKILYVNSSSTKLYTEWSKWSRCIDCLQKRIKKCVNPKCHNSKMYEERHCNKKRCRRKARQKEAFHVVHLNESRSYLTKQGYSDIWSKWSKWTDCSPECKTYRIRRCKKPGRCRKHIQKETAYCYHERSNCEVYVLNLLEVNQKRPQDNRRYQYNNNANQQTDQQHLMRVPRKKRCGVPYRKTRMLKIIGGIEATRYKWPWHVAVLNQFMEVFCGGTLVSSRWVLTASHCIRKYLRVRLNAHDLRSRDGSDIEMVVHKMFPHPKFDYKTVDNDIALLLLPKAVKTPTACLPNRKPTFGQLCSVMGWGKTRTSDLYGVPVLHEAKLPLVTHKTCKKSYKEFLISNNMMCAGWVSGRSDTCAGDSGGGLMCPVRKSKHPSYTIQGITSFGDGCGRRNKYGIYTTVLNYIDWITYIMDHYS